MYFNTRVFDCVLLAIGRNNTAHIVGGAPAGQVPTLYHDTRLSVRLDNGLRAQHTLQVSYLTLMISSLVEGIIILSLNLGHVEGDISDTSSS